VVEEGDKIKEGACALKEKKEKKFVGSQSPAAFLNRYQVSCCVLSVLNDRGIMKAPHPSLTVAGLSWMNQNERKNITFLTSD